MKKLIKGNMPLFVLVVVVGLLSTSLNILVAYIIGAILDSIGTGDFEKLKSFGILIAIFILAFVLINILHTYLAGKFSKNILHSLKSNIFNTLSNYAIYDYQDKEMSYYYNMLTHDLDEINSNYIERTHTVIIAIGAFLMNMAVLFFIDVKMAAIFVGLTMIIIILPSFLSKFQTDARSSFSKGYEKYVSQLENILSGFESIKVLNISKILFKNMTNNDNEMESLRLKSAVVDDAVTSIISGGSFAVQLLCILVGAYFVMIGNITVGQLIMATQLLNLVFSPIQIISDSLNLMKSTKELRDKVEVYLERDTENKIKASKGSIEFESYALKLGDKEVFNDFNYTFENDKSYIIIGESGSGKSTLAKSIAGFYNDFSGDIKYNKESIRDIDLNTLPEIVRYISTNTYVIDDSLKENIRLYKDIPDDVIDSIIKRVGLNREMLNKEDLGHNAKFISSGEYQRMAIARAMVEKPHCVIFDEPTSNLDKENSKKIQQLILDLEVPIKIVISHDYDEEYLKAFDEVINFNNLK